MVIQRKKQVIPVFFSLTVVLILVLSWTLSVSGQSESPQTEMPQLDIPGPQMFCGYCHILTYPSIIKKNHKLWEEGKHNRVGCIKCHYPPKTTKKTNQPPIADNTTYTKHIPKGPQELFPFVQLGGETVRMRPRVVDASCMTTNCHGSPDDMFKTKKIMYTEKVPFVHKPHLERKNQIEGQQINCTSCHQHETDKKKFEVVKAICHLCHFKNVRFNQGRGRCELCHALPEKPIQTSGEKPITHEMLKEAEVSCASCHIELIQASGGGKYDVYFERGTLKTALILGAGRIKKENCLACHDQSRYLKEDGNKKLMHEKHVAIKNARCLECHQPILHTKADLEKPIEQRPVHITCEACHFAPHRYQRLLYAGPKREGVSKTPDFMFEARTNCLGCHVEKTVTNRGQTVMKASDMMCVRCHTNDYKRIFGIWKKEVGQEVRKAEKLQKEALDTLNKYMPDLTKQKLTEVREMMRAGRESLDIVRFGNGVHNAKYSIALLDVAISDFEDAIAYLKGEELSEEPEEE